MAIAKFHINVIFHKTCKKNKNKNTATGEYAKTLDLIEKVHLPIAVGTQTLINTNLPIHSSSELSSVLPTEHKHTKEPLLFLQSPLIQGLDLHSSTSKGDKKK